MKGKRLYILSVLIAVGLVAQLIFVFPASAAYISQATVISTNLISGSASSISNFYYNISSLPGNSSVKIQFSRDNSNWYSSSGAAGAWDTLSATGGADLSLASLGWSGSGFYYKIQLNATSDLNQTPTVEEIHLDYVADSGSEKSFVFDNAGNVGIGTTNPIARLHAYGDGALAAIFNNGNVGIGKTNPGVSLDINSSLRAISATVTSLSPGGIIMADVNGLLYATSTAVATGLPSPVGISGQTLRSNGTNWLANSLLFNDGLNIGIGITNPTSRLALMGSGAASTTNAFYIQNSSSTPLFVVQNGGNVGIGKTDPGFMLDVNSSFRAGLASVSSLSPGGIVMADASGLLYATSTAIATGLPSPIGISGQTLRSNGTSWLANSFLFNTGTNIGIGLTLPAQKLDISGALKLANATVTATDTTIGNRYLCDATTTGTFRYDATSGQSYLCDGTRWLNQENCGVMTDDEGHTYGTVQIGGQCFMAENINIGTMLGAGTTEPTTTDNIIQKWCYNNLESNCVLYGGLYNWNEAMRGASFSGARGICPSGWHIPTDVEYNNLEKTVQGIINSPNAQYPCDFSVAGWRRCADNNGADSGGTYGAGKSLKGVGIGSGNGLGNDLVGFNGKLTGARTTSGTYYDLGATLNLWSSTPSGASNAWYRTLYTSYSTVYRNTGARAYGFSVRCLRD